MDGAAGNSRDDCVRHHRRRDRAALVELAAAAAFRMAPHHVLAGARTAAPLPDSVWWLGRIQGWERAPASSLERTHGGTNGRTHARTVGKDDTGGTREIPPGTSRLLGGSTTASRVEDQRLIRYVVLSLAFKTAPGSKVRMPQWICRSLGNPSLMLFKVWNPSFTTVLLMLSLVTSTGFSRMAGTSRLPLLTIL